MKPVTSVSSIVLVITFVFLAVFVAGEIQMHRFIKDCDARTTAILQQVGPDEEFVPNQVSARFGLSSWSGPCGGQIVKKHSD